MKPAGPRSVSSTTLAPLLHDLGISLVVSTYKSGQVILVRAEDASTVNTHFASFTSPMGIAARHDRIAVACTNTITHFYNQPDLGPEIEPKGRHDACFLPRRVEHTGNIRLHEIAFVGAGARAGAASDAELWVVNTYFSALCTIDGVHSFVPRWQPPFISALAPEDRCHLNGLAVDGDRVRTVTAFSETDTANGWRERIGPHGVAIDVESGEAIVRGLWLPHSPRWHSGELWMLSSGQGTLVKADLARGRAETVAELPGFTRGLAFAGPFAFIGLSQVRDQSSFRGGELLARVPELACGVWVVDLRSGRTAAFLRFEAAVQEIFDVQVLPGIRYPILFPPHSPLADGMFVVPPK